MPLPIPNLDDRRFDDLVIEAKERLARQLPELTQVVPGDPIHCFIDLFAWMTETIIYRANLIPERQRRVFLNLLQIPLRAAVPARGVVCIDAGPRSIHLPSLVTAGAQLKAEVQSFSTIGEIQPTPLQLNVLIKERVDDETLAQIGFTLEQLREQHNIKSGDVPVPFQPHNYVLGKETLGLANSLDRAYYLALSIPKTLVNDRDEVKASLAGVIINIALVPADEMEGDEAEEVPPRELAWDIVYQDSGGDIYHLPMEVVYDSSLGGRQLGVVRLRLPRNPALLQSLSMDDPMFAGVGNLPPELPAKVTAEQLLCWIRLTTLDGDDFELGYMGINSVEVIAQGIRLDTMVGIGSGQPDQMMRLPDENIDADSISLDVEEEGQWVRWETVDYLTGHQPQDRVYRLDSRYGNIYFGDGISGKRPPEGSRVRIAEYRHGGGVSGNVAPESITELNGGARLKVRHEWPCSGGIDAESIEHAERRIPDYLSHRNRAVTSSDYQTLAVNNPVNPVARAEVRPGLLPGNNIKALRTDVPGVVSVFVLPPRQPMLAQTPKPTKGLLKDVFHYLRDRTVLGTELYVLSPQFIPLAVSVTVTVSDPQTEQQTLRAVQQSLVEFLWPVAPGGVQQQGWPLGGAVKPSELITHMARVDGVQSINGVSLFTQGDNGWYALAKGQSLNLLDYQLPELLAASVASGVSDNPGMPKGLLPTSGGGAPGGAGMGGAGGQAIPAPIIPDVC